MDAFSNSCSSSSSNSLSAVCPKSPPGVLDLYGKRRQLVKVQILEREIGLLQDEIKSVEDLQPASRCCKELNDFIGAKQDPLVSIKEETPKSNVCWKNFCVQWICCFSGCQAHLKKAKYYYACCPLSNSHLNLCSCSEKPACQHCCKCAGLSRPRFGCCCFSSSLCNSPKMNLCCCCSNSYCKSCC